MDGGIETLSEEHIYDLRTAFSSVDRDNDGLIQTKEVRAIYVNLDPIYKPMEMNEEELKRWIDLVDIDETGQLSFAQFLIIIANGMHVTDTVEELREAFNTFDRANAGFVTIDDLWRIMHMLGENLTKAEIEEMMNEADADGDGKIYFEEFVNMITYTP